jgi:hypothetical protein
MVQTSLGIITFEKLIGLGIFIFIFAWFSVLCITPMIWDKLRGCGFISRCLLRAQDILAYGGDFFIHFFLFFIYYFKSIL